MPSAKNITLHERKRVDFHLTGIVCFVLGALCMFAGLYFLVFPAINITTDTSAEEALAASRLEVEAQAYTIEERDQEITGLLAQISQQQAQYAARDREMDVINRSLVVLSAAELLNDGRLREAVDVLGYTETTGLAPDIVERATHIRTTAYPVLMREYYNEGVRVYNARNFEESLTYFERAQRFAYDDWDMSGEILYYIAFAWSQNLDTERAIEYFEQFLYEFPGHRRTTPATSRLNAIS
jgi:tetratricopeptide (TPR) repeat protein